MDENWAMLSNSERERLYIEENWEEAQYIIINTTYARMYSTEQYQQVKESSELIDSFSSYGNVICEVYRRNQ